MLKRRWWIAGLALLLAAAGGAAALRKGTDRAPQPAAVAAQPAPLEFLPGDILELKRQALRQTLPLSGALRPVSQAAVKARVAGEVREVLVREGEAVEAGQVLVRMETGDYQARVDQAIGSLRAAQGQLDIAARTRDNNKALLAKGFISQNAFDTAESQHRIARANVDSARGALEVARKSLADTVIRAPVAGVVSSRSVEPGEKVSPDNRLFDLVDVRRLELEAAVPSADILRVAVGQEAVIRVEGAPAPFAGKVVRINPATESGSRSIMVYIQVDNPQGVLRAGIFAEAQLTVAEKAGILAVPRAALQDQGGASFVYAIEDGVLTRRPVTLGLAGNDGQGPVREVLTGLEEGMRIVRNNLGSLRVGAPARIVSSAPAELSAAK
ncbi:MAG: efflux RND transporter periplasmic adaptor subunit [Noviherbaspirillum sp.]